jgi:hypothetical protein
MGNDYCGQRQKDQYKTIEGHTKIIYRKCTKEICEKYQDLKEEARERYEEAKFVYREKKKAELKLTSPKKCKRRFQGNTFSEYDDQVF